MSAIGAIALFVVVTTFSLRVINQANDKRMADVASSYTKHVRKASLDYIQDHYDELLDTLSGVGDSRKAFDVETLKDEGYLNDSFAEKNLWGQKPTVYIRQGNSLQKMEALMVGVPDSKDENTAIVPYGIGMNIAANVGADGGFLVDDYCGTEKVNALTFCGTNRMWEVKASDYGIGGKAGRVAVALFFEDSTQVSDYVYRKHVPGHPELNTMDTYLQLGDNALAKEDEACYRVKGDPASGLLENGAIAKNSKGEILSCQDGSWSKAATDNFKASLKCQSKSGSSVQSCPSGYNATGASVDRSGEHIIQIRRCCKVVLTPF